MTNHAIRVRTLDGWQDLALTGPQGPQGPPGTPGGATGPQGPTGAQGQSMDGCAVGTVNTFTGRSLPFGYVIADGATYTQGQYPQGYDFAVSEQAVGNSLWTADTSGKTFTVPNLVERFLLGSKAQTFASKAGEASHQLSTTELPNHVHDIKNLHSTSQQALYITGSGSTFIAPGVSPSTPTDLQGGNGAHNNMPPYVVLAYIVKVAGITIDPTSGIVQGPPGPQGSQGPPGTSATGSMIYKGGYDPSKNYALNDVVIWKGHSYVCITPVTGSGAGFGYYGGKAGEWYGLNGWSVAVPIPSGAAVGDLCIMGACNPSAASFAGGAPTDSLLSQRPAGFTLLDHNSITATGSVYNSGVEAAIYYKVLTAGDISNGTFTWGGSNNGIIDCRFYHRVAVPTAPTWSMLTSTTTGIVSVVPPTISLSAGDIALHFLLQCSENAGAPTGVDPTLGGSGGKNFIGKSSTQTYGGGVGVGGSYDYDPAASAGTSPSTASFLTQLLYFQNAAYGLASIDLINSVTFPSTYFQQL